MNAVMGYCSPDPFAEALGTGYQRFQSPTGISGLAKQDGERIDVLAVHADAPGTGQFRDFILGCKAAYKTVRILEVWNLKLAEVLPRYGFKACFEIECGETIRGWVWHEE